MGGGRAKMTTLQNKCNFEFNKTSQKCTINDLCNLIKPHVVSKMYVDYV